MSKLTRTGHRREAMWLAAMVHRVSGLLLAAFLPLHFLALALALDGEARLDGFLRWTDTPLFKVAETGLVGLLAVHLLGGMRILMVEVLAWTGAQKELAYGAIAASIILAALFLLRLI